MSLLISLLVLALAGGLIWWAVNAMPIPPGPKKIILIILLVIFILVLPSFVSGVLPALHLGL